MYKNLIIFSIVCAYLCNNKEQIDQLQKNCYSFKDYKEKIHNYNTENLFLEDIYNDKDSSHISMGHLYDIKSINWQNQQIQVKRIKIQQNENYSSLVKEIELKNSKEDNHIQNILFCAFDSQNKYLFIAKELPYMKLQQLHDNKKFHEQFDKFMRLDYYKQLAQILKEFHNKNLVHGEIMPSDFYFENRNFENIKISNFSMIGTEGEKKLLSRFVDSPENNRKSKVLTYSSDLYQLGITIVYMEDKDNNLLKLFNNKNWKKNYFPYNNKKLKKFAAKIFDQNWIKQKNIFQRLIQWIRSIFVKQSKCNQESPACIITSLIELEASQRISLDQFIEQTDQFLNNNQDKKILIQLIDKKLILLQLIIH